MIVPRDYQTAGDDALWTQLHSRHGENPLVVIPTGGGKSLMMAMAIKRLLTTYPHLRILSVTHVKELIKNNHDTLKKIWPAAPAGIYSAGLGIKNLRAQVTFAGVMSIINRGIGKVDFLFVDEAHTISDNEKATYGKLIAHLKGINPNMLVIGFTATPFRMTSGMLVDGQIFDRICFDMSDGEAFVWMVENGYLIRPVAKHPGFQLDSSLVTIKNGEFDAKGASDAMREQDIIERAVDTAIELGEEQGRKAWLTFNQSIDDAELVADMFTYKGYPHRAIHSKRNDRDETLDMFRRGHLRGVTNQGVLTTGYDQPNLDMIIMLRLTRSPGLWCLSMDTEILTTRGFVGPHDLDVTDTLITADPNTLERRESPVLAKIIRPMYKDEYFIKLNNASHAFKVSNKHRMLVNIPFGKNKDKRLQFITAAQLLQRYDAAAPLNVSGAFPGVNLSASQLEFLGYWLADGTFDISNNTLQWSSSDRYPEVQQRIDELCIELNLGVRCSAMAAEKLRGYDTDFGCRRWALSYDALRGPRKGMNGWRSLAQFLDKRIPESYDNITKDQLLSLIKGLCLGDGNKHKTADYTPKTYTIAMGRNKRMADRLQFLCVQRGLAASIGSNGMGCIMLRIKSRQFHNVVNKSSAREGCKIDFTPEDVWCVQSEQGTLITRYKGHVMVTGNCQMVGRGTRPDFASGFDISTLEGRKQAILASGKQTCLVLDFVGNTERLGLINYPRIPKKRGTGDGGQPVRLCPVCNSYVHISLKTCPECGHEFPPPERVRPEASTAELMVSALGLPPPPPTKIEIFDVHRMICSYHEGRNNKPDTLRVDYFCGLQRFSQWICFNHPEGSYPKTYARRWWQWHNGGPFPDSVTDAYAASSKLRAPKFLKVRTGTKYPEVLEHDFIGTRFELPPEAGGPPLREPSPDPSRNSINDPKLLQAMGLRADYDDDDIPF